MTCPSHHVMTTVSSLCARSAESIPNLQCGQRKPRKMSFWRSSRRPEISSGNFSYRYVAVTSMHGGFACFGSMSREDYPSLGLARNHSQQAHRHDTRVPSTVNGSSIGQRRRARAWRRLVAEQSSADGRKPLARRQRFPARPQRSPDRVPLAPRRFASRISAANDRPNRMKI